MHDTRTSPFITCCAALCLICKLAKCISDCDFLQTTYTTLKKKIKPAGLFHSKPSSSTSKMRVALGGMMPGWPLFP